MPTTPCKEPTCQCCGMPLMAAPILDKDIGEVCEDCKTQLRWAQAYLKSAKIEGCVRAGPDYPHGSAA